MLTSSATNGSTIATYVADFLLFCNCNSITSRYPHSTTTFCGQFLIFFQPKYNASTFALRDRLGGGNFGVVYEAVQRPRALQITQTGGCDLSELRCMHVCALHGITGTNDHLHRHGSSLSLAVHAVCVALQSVLVHILSAPACINGCGQVTAVTVSH